jgi:DNA-binding transcriptional regulator YhcF (GntR family)
MLFRVDPSSALGLADQLAAQVRGALATGALTAGEQLPAARQVAAGLDINMHTVLRAYQALRDGGLIDLRRGRGAVVRADVDADAVAMHEAIGVLAARMVRGGWSEDRAADALRHAIRALQGPAIPERSDTDEGNSR